VQHRGMVVTAQDDELGEVAHIRSPIKMTGTKSGGGGVAVRTTAPKLGQHNAEVYGSVGLNADKLAELKAKGVI
jgi:formyl-CoA transferase